MKSVFNKKILSYLIFLLIILLPFQTRYFLFTEKIGNNFFEYGSISIYFIDIIILSLIFFQILILIKQKIKLDKKNIIFLILLAIFNISVFCSILISQNKAVSFYFFSKIFLLSTFSYLLSIIKFNKKYLINGIIFSASIQAFVAIYQFITQNIFSNKYLGIASQDPSSLGVSVIENTAGRFLRSYGSLPHPNILSLFLLLALFFIILKIIKLNEIKEKDKIIFFQKAFYFYIFGINSLALIFTFSRIAIIIYIIMLVSFLFYFIFKIIKEKENINIYRKNISYLLLIFLMFFCISINFSNLLITRFNNSNRLTVKSNTERIDQIKIATKIIKNNFLQGIGARNYSTYQYNKNKNTWDLAPVHNIYLLIFAEIGVIGFLSFIGLLIFTFINNKNIKLLIPFYVILIIGLFDHFIWTESFGLILFFIFLGINNKTID